MLLFFRRRNLVLNSEENTIILIYKTARYIYMTSVWIFSVLKNIFRLKQNVEGLFYRGWITTTFCYPTVHCGRPFTVEFTFKLMKSEVSLTDLFRVSYESA